MAREEAIGSISKNTQALTLRAPKKYLGVFDGVNFP